jgi:hypothetical protein
MIFSFVRISYTKINNAKRGKFMRLEFQKRSELKFVSRINETQILQTQYSNIC